MSESLRDERGVLCPFEGSDVANDSQIRLMFRKMRTDYDSFRMLKENDKISRVRQYYIQKAKEEGKVEMPWWMGNTTSVNLSFFNDISTENKGDIIARTLILFPSVFSKDSSLSYKEVALWLCNHYSLQCYNMRDFFSASGQMTRLNGKLLEHPLPRVVAKLLMYNDRIKAILRHPDVDILMDIQEYWDFRYQKTDLYSSWLNHIEKVFKENNKLCEVPIKEWLESGAIGE